MIGTDRLALQLIRMAEEYGVRLSYTEAFGLALEWELGRT